MILFVLKSPAGHPAGLQIKPSVLFFRSRVACFDALFTKDASALFRSLSQLLTHNFPFYIRFEKQVFVAEALRKVN